MWLIGGKLVPDRQAIWILLSTRPPSLQLHLCGAMCRSGARLLSQQINLKLRLIAPIRSRKHTMQQRTPKPAWCRRDWCFNYVRSLAPWPLMNGLASEINWKTTFNESAMHNMWISRSRLPRTMHNRYVHVRFMFSSRDKVAPAKSQSNQCQNKSAELSCRCALAAPLYVGLWSQSLPLREAHSARYSDHVDRVLSEGETSSREFNSISSLLRTTSWE